MKSMSGYRRVWHLRHGLFFGIALVFACKVRREWYPTDHKAFFPHGDPYLTLREQEEGVDYGILNLPKHYSLHVD